MKAPQMPESMERILVIGGNGSGKTTFSIRLAEKLRLPLVHLDRLYWKDHWTHAADEEFDTLLLAELEKPRWVIDGNFNRTLPLRLQYCDTVIYFDFPTAKCLWGVVTRVLKNYGKSRPDMGGCCPDHFDLPFLKDVWTFNKRRRRYYSLLDDAEHVHVVIVKSRKSAYRYLEGL